MNTNFTLEQLNQIDLGKRNGLTEKQVETYAKLNFSDSQMREIRLGYERKLTDEQVKLYAKVHIKDTMMSAVRLELQKGLTFEQEKEFFTYEFSDYCNWVSEQSLRMLIKCIRKGIPRRQIEKIIKMCESRPATDIRTFIENGKLEIALNGILADFTIKEVELYAQSALSVEQSKEIYLGLTGGLSVEEVKCYAHYSISADRMKKIRNCLLKAKQKVN